MGSPMGASVGADPVGSSVGPVAEVGAGVASGVGKDGVGGGAVPSVAVTGQSVFGGGTATRQWVVWLGDIGLLVGGCLFTASGVEVGS